MSNDVEVPLSNPRKILERHCKQENRKPKTEALGQHSKGAVSLQVLSPDKIMSDNFKTWEKQGKLGKGGFGEVWKVRTDAGAVLAAKYINTSQSQSFASSLGQVQQEVDMLKKLNNRNIVKFVAVRTLENQLVIFTEFIDGSDLAKRSPIQSVEKIQGFLKQICSGLNYLHSCSPPVLHRDIKGQNIMVTKDDTVKLIDFGISLNLMVASGMSASQAINTTANQCGTLPFMAPELFSDRSQFSMKSDVWAFGITVYQMVTGQIPFCDLSDSSAIIDKITGVGAPPLPTNLGSRTLEDFYACCTAMQARDRKSARELQQHDFLA